MRLPFSAPLWPWERRLVPEADQLPGLIHPRHTLLLTLSLTAALLLWAGINNSPWGYTLLAFPLARLIALDLTHHILPDLYTLPLLIAGATMAGLSGTGMPSILGASAAFALGFVLLGCAWVCKQHAGVGGGDLKLLIAVGMWVGFPEISLVIALSCLISSPFLLSNRPYFPLGPGLILALWLWIHHKIVFLDLINRLSLLI